jgi:hypothetical protein
MVNIRLRHRHGIMLASSMPLLTCMNGLQTPSLDWYSDDCVDMLVEEAQKVYNTLAKKCIEGSVDEYAASTISSSLPPLPSPDDEKGGIESDLM